jgi:hypothetical protein
VAQTLSKALRTKRGSFAGADSVGRLAVRSRGVRPLRVGLESEASLPDAEFEIRSADNLDPLATHKIPECVVDVHSRLVSIVPASPERAALRFIYDRSILQTGGQGLPEWIELVEAPSRFIRLEKATKKQILDVARLHETMARAHRDEARILRRFASGEIKPADKGKK